MKKSLKILAGIFVGLAILIALLIVFLNTIVVKTVNEVGPAALGVPVALQDARVRPFRGKTTLTGLHVGNPEGFKTAGLLDLGSIAVQLDRASLLTDTLVIKKIAIDGLVVTYERGMFNSNLGALIDQLSAQTEAEEKKNEPEKPGRKVVIEQVVITGGRMNVSLTGAAALTGGGVLPIPLPTITLSDIGKEQEGVTLVEAFRYVLLAIAKTTGTALAGSAKLLGQGAGAVGDGAWALGAGAVNLVTGGGKTNESAGTAEAVAPSGTNAASRTAVEALGHLLGK